jgi:hypothetical protein
LSDKQKQKKSPSQVKRNADRRNGKAFKTSGASRNRRTPLTELEKALLGGGAMKRITRRLPGVSVDR